jgi:hypothetical protein
MAAGGLRHAEKTLELRLAILLGGLGAERCRQVLGRLRFSAHAIDTASALVERRGDIIEASAVGVKRGLCLMGEARLRMLIKLKMALAMAASDERERALATETETESEAESAPEFVPGFTPEPVPESAIGIVPVPGRACAEAYMQHQAYTRSREYRQCLECLKCLDGVIARNECYSLKTLRIGGDGLILAGFKPGRALGGALEALLRLVVEEKCENSEEALAERAAKLLRQGQAQ